MKKFGKPEGKGDLDDGERGRRRARSKRLPEPDQNPWFWAQFAQQDSNTKEEVLSSEEDVRNVTEADSAPSRGREEQVTIWPVRRNLSLAVQEAVVRVETGLNRILIGGRRVPIEDPVWDSFEEYRAEHREAVARQEEEERQRTRETGTGDKENVVLTIFSKRVFVVLNENVV